MGNDGYASQNMYILPTYFNHVYYIFESLPKVKNKNKTNIFKFVLLRAYRNIVYNILVYSGCRIKIVAENTASL